MFGFSAPETSFYRPLLLDPTVSTLVSEARFIRAMLEVEGALARAQADVGLLPADSAEAIAQACDQLEVPAERLASGTAKDGVPVPALVSELKNAVGADHSPWVHYGATSQDIADTALVLVCREVLGHLRGSLRRVIAQLAEQTEATRDILVAGRTRSQQGAPVNLALKVARWNRPLIRQLRRLAEVEADLYKVQLAGAVGNLSVLGDQADGVADALADRLGLVSDGGWHTQRDSVLVLGNWLAVTGSALGKMAFDWLLMAQTEVGELRFTDGGGSSTMPQKSNPVVAEIIQSLAAHLGSQAGHLMQSAVMAHERDGAAWTREWLTLPGMLSHAGAALSAAERGLANLAWSPDAMERNLWQTRGLLFAETITFELARQMPRDAARSLVTRSVQSVLADDTGRSDLLQVVNREAGSDFDADTLSRRLLHAGCTDSDIDRALREAAEVTR